MRSVKKPCAVPSCPILVDVGIRYCDRHAAMRVWQRDTRSTTDRGYGHAWRKIREHVLMTEPLCRTCAAAGRTVAATDVDHIVPKHMDGTDEIENLQPLCRACHNRKTAREKGHRG